MRIRCFPTIFRFSYVFEKNDQRQNSRLSSKIDAVITINPNIYSRKTSTINEIPLSPTEQAQARQNTYSLFSRLYLHGITADYLPYLKSIPDLARTLPDSFDPDEMAAAHQTLFGFNIFPNASIFLDPSRLLGGPIANQHAEAYHQSNFLPESAVDPDHISQCLDFLSHLSSLEAAQIESDLNPTTLHIQQNYFMESHFLPWLIPFTIAVEHQENPFYTSLAQLTLTLVGDHYSSLNLLHLNVLNQTSFRPNTPSELPSLEDGRTGLRQIARFLVTPVQSGIYLGRSDINQLARRLNLPHGFGSREQMLQTLIQSAGQYESAPQLFAAFKALLESWQQAYQRIIGEYSQLTHFTSPWQLRLQQTQALISQMEQKV